MLQIYYNFSRLKERPAHFISKFLLIIMLVCAQLSQSVWAVDTPNRPTPPTTGVDYWKKVGTASEWTYSLATVLGITPLNFLVNFGLLQLQTLLGGGAAISNADFDRMRGIIRDEIAADSQRKILRDIRLQIYNLTSHSRGNSIAAWQTKTNTLKNELPVFAQNLDDMIKKDGTNETELRNKLFPNYVQGVQLYAAMAMELVELITITESGAAAENYLRDSGVYNNLAKMEAKLLKGEEWYRNNSERIEMRITDMSSNAGYYRRVIDWPAGDGNNNERTMWQDETNEYYRVATIPGYNPYPVIYGPGNGFMTYLNEQRGAEQESWRFLNYYRDDFLHTADEAEAVRTKWVSTLKNMGDFNKKIIGVNDWSLSKTASINNSYATSQPGFVGTFLSIYDVDTSDFASISAFGSVGLYSADERDAPFLTIYGNARLWFRRINAEPTPFKAVQLAPPGSDFAISATHNLTENDANTRPRLQDIRTWTFDVDGNATRNATLTVKNIYLFSATYNKSRWMRPAPGLMINLPVSNPTVTQNGGNIVLNWLDPAYMNSTGTKVEDVANMILRSDNGGPYQIRHVERNYERNTWVDTETLNTNTNPHTYRYKLRRYFAFDTGSGYNESSPVNLLVPGPTWRSIQVYRNRMKLTWNGVAQAKQYDVNNAYLVSGGGFEVSSIPLIENIPATSKDTQEATFNFTDGFFYPRSFGVIAENDDGSDLSYPGPVAQADPFKLPNDVTNIRAVAGQNLNALSWDHSGATPTNFLISRREAGKTKTDLYSVAGSLRSWSDTAATPGVGYQYTVRARLREGIYEYTHDYPTYTTAVAYRLNQPSGVTATPQSRAVTLSWSSVRGAKNYEIQHRVGSSGAWVGGLQPQTSILVSSLTPNTPYTFRVRAIAAVSSANSNWVTVTATPRP